MTILKHELRRGRLPFLIWTGAVGALLAICVFLFPEMKGEMEEMNDMFASMGSFTAAFGMDKLNFGTLIGYYAIECGNVLGLGGAFFAALTAVSMLSKEEKDRTAEFLLTHPVSRRRIVAQKLAALILQVAALNAAVCLISIASMAAVGEKIPWREVNRMHGCYFLLQLEIAGICFGISAFLRKGGLAVGLGAAILLYMLNLLSNITKSAAFLKYVTPFGYCDGAELVTEGADPAKIAIGMALGLAGIAAAFLHYCRKDVYSN